MGADKKSKKEKKSKKDKTEKKRPVEEVEEAVEVEVEAPKAKKAKKEKKEKKEKKSKKEKKDKEEEAPVVEETPAEEVVEKAEEPAKADESSLGVNPDGIKKCFIGNLSFNIDDDQAKDFFKDCGEIEELFWCQDKDTGKFYGTGFVTFTTTDGARKAVAKNGEDLLGRPIKCEYSKPRPGGDKPKKQGRKFEMSAKPDGCTTCFLGNLSYDIDDDKCREFFASAGEISHIRWLTDRESGEFKGCGFVEFSDPASVDEAVKLGGKDLLGRAIRIDYAAPSKPKSY